ncbi:MAG: lysophospholipid acyltransferase family protein [Vicinamibacteria bacterium]
MIRFAFTILTACLATIVLSPVGILAWPFRQDGEIGFFVTRVWARTILAAAGVRAIPELLAELPSGPVVFVSNHVSALDIPILFAALPRSFRIVYKSSLVYVPFMGLFLAAARNVSIDRSRAFKAKRSLTAAAQRIHDGVSVALFPEGTRSGTAPMGSFKRGSFKLAMQAQVPVIPVSLVGLRTVVGERSITPGTVRVRIHEALPFDPGRDAMEALAASAEDVIRKEVRLQ